ncbi:alpha/beta fold hydrolase [Nitriliruptoraceae bacterium ZYF776]|nr:alpha/beta fold hydrolase [Profundirhabdus halotolerans]
MSVATIHRTEVDGRSLHGTTWLPVQRGRRGPVVLVHGLGMSRTYHRPLAEELVDRGWPVHALDLPGFGASPGPRRALDIVELGAALRGWLHARRLADAALVGNSIGCQVVTETALTDPGRCRSLVLLSPTLDARARRWRHQLARWRREGSTQTWSMRRTIARDFVRAGPPRVVGTFRHALHDRPEERLPFLHQPALVVRGSRDPVVPPRWAREVADGLPRGELRELPGATHAVNHEQPAQTARVLDHFLRAA